MVGVERERRGASRWLVPKIICVTLGMAIKSPSAGTSRTSGGAVRGVLEEQPVECVTDRRTEQDDGDEERSPLRPAVRDGDVEDDRRDVRLGAEGQVEHTRRLVGEHEAGGHQGVGAPVGDARERVGEELAQLERRPRSLTAPATRRHARAERPAAGGTTRWIGPWAGLGTGKQLNTLGGVP